VQSAMVFAPQPWEEVRKDHCRECEELRWLNTFGLCGDCHKQKHPPRLRIINVCQTCKEYDDLKFICSTCKTSDVIYAEGTTECFSCFYGEDWVGTKELDKCVSCKQIDHLNKEGVCKTCYAEDRVKKTQNNDWGRIQRCSKCKKFMEGLNSSGICNSCTGAEKTRTKNCYGCSESFVTSSKYDTFCLKCKENMDRGVCTNCLNLSSVVDQRGRCSKCKNE